ncbi:HIT domain-containing protein [Flavobacteriaceae bacterium]|jgi:histidine triad (HIT) family protein|nr:HIT domain-containing protein [Flavobacteriaceae bacterium]MDB2336709.1 HIT domain-containing protein [Flavobacteriaceae bacterium]MDB2418665.1 HIT domain-containing protein [Flavobacteriaceae bacterium]MDB2491066.1 HIT domain-containing protein [Flavobacteriaceae bacterium]MDB2624945.1 HIT domain-containing protein [Flavobacteriaceae bacterium]|tara:strand:- start:7442 stop:7831 length:390 start_codon:yes stop_codon:yes gene_type:complete
MSIFTKIVSGEIPSYKLAEDDNYLAFLDINPNTKGHTLVIPKKEINKLFDLDQKEYLDLMSFSYRVAKAIEKTVPCKRIGMSVIGLEVPHVHVHLIPINTMSNMRFVEKEKLTSNEFESLAKDISSNFS